MMRAIDLRSPGLALAGLIVSIAFACGPSDRDVRVADDGDDSGPGTSGRGGTSQGGGSGRGGSGTADAGHGGEAPSSCVPACTGDTPVCEEGRCVAHG